MELEVFEREGSPKKMRREGKIPAVLYGQKSVAIDAGQFEACLRKLPKGGLSTAVFTLTGAVKCKAIIKEIQYHPTTYAVLHIDFLELKKGASININVPIRYAGEADCPGVKLGGVLRPVIRAMPVTCPADKVPTEFVLDVRDLRMGGVKRLSDIQLPEGVVPQGRVKVEEVALVIGKG